MNYVRIEPKNIPFVQSQSVDKRIFVAEYH